MAHTSKAGCAKLRSYCMGRVKGQKLLSSFRLILRFLLLAPLPSKISPYGLLLDGSGSFNRGFNDFEIFNIAESSLLIA
jgi:hypothetical protein